MITYALATTQAVIVAWLIVLIGIRAPERRSGDQPTSLRDELSGYVDDLRRLGRRLRRRPD